MRFLTSILIVVVAVGCESVKAPVSGGGAYPGPGTLWVRNASDEDFYDLVFQGNRFGDVKKGQLTEYQSAAYWSPHGERITVLPGEYPQEEISLQLAGYTNRLRYIWVDRSGRCVNGTNRVTFVLTLHQVGDSKHLDIEEHKDE